MPRSDTHLSVRLAETDADLRAAARLRYEVFVEELGGDGAMVDHAARIETDRFDPFFEHMILVDDRRDAGSFDHVVGVYRLLRQDRAEAAGQFYSADEYDLTPLLKSGRRLLEVGRSCVHRDYRGGTALFRLWQGLGAYVLGNGIEILFGVASFHGTDPAPLTMPLSHLHHAHLAPPELRVRARDEARQEMNLLPPEAIDRPAAIRAVPPLIKAYLRIGGYVGDGAFVDAAFNTTDVCMIVDVDRIPDRARANFGGVNG